MKLLLVIFLIASHLFAKPWCTCNQVTQITKWFTKKKVFWRVSGNTARQNQGPKQKRSRDSYLSTTSDLQMTLKRRAKTWIQKCTTAVQFMFSSSSINLNKHAIMPAILYPPSPCSSSKSTFWENKARRFRRGQLKGGQDTVCNLAVMQAQMNTTQASKRKAHEIESHRTLTKASLCELTKRIPF